MPDKEVALIFVFLLGYYPLAKPRFDRIRPAVLRCVCKLLLCNAAVLAMYGLLLVLIPAGSISQELRTTAWIVTLSTLAMGNVAFLLYDRALHNLLMLYRLVWQPSCTECWACTENDCCTAVAQNGKAWYTEPSRFTGAAERGNVQNHQLTAAGHAGDSREGDEERNHRKFRRMFLRLKARPAAEKGKKRQ